MKPSLGRIVHYTMRAGPNGRFPPEQQAAIITRVVVRGDTVSLGPDPNDPPDECNWVVSLHIFHPEGDFYMPDVPFSDAYERGHWTWPPRVNTTLCTTCGAVNSFR